MNVVNVFNHSQLILQPGFLDVCAENISRDLSQCLFNYTPEYLNNAFNNFKDTVVNTLYTSNASKNWFDYHCSKGYNAFCGLVASNPMSATKAVTNTAACAILYYLPHIVNYFYTIPAGEYTFGNSLAMVTAIVSQQYPDFFAYQLALNVGGGNGFVISQHIFGPFTKFGTILGIQVFSNQVADNPDLFKDYTVLFAFKPCIWIAGYYFFRWCIPLLFQGINSPLDQFELISLLSIDTPILANIYLSISNVGLYLSISALTLGCLIVLASKYKKVLIKSLSSCIESLNATVNSIVINQVNGNKAQAYISFIFVLFIFILVNNLIGMIPYSFAPTSHFLLSFSISFSIVFGSTILGFIKHSLKFFSLFVPGGCPAALLPLLVLIEFISYLARNISLGLRLAANILSGHMLLNILSGFAYNIMASSYSFLLIGLIPLTFITSFSGLELGISFIQAQVFVVLTSSYLKDGLDLH